MIKGDKTFQLIKSLSKSEKRFFKIYSSRHVIGEKNNYVQLFEAIDKQEVYDEIVIKKRFADEKFTNRLSVAKAYLYDLILKSMTAYQSQNSIDTQIYEGLSQVKFLFNKNLYSQAKTVVDKVKKLAESYERHSIVPEIIYWEKRIYEATSFANIDVETLKELQRSERTALHALDHINDLWNLQSQLYLQHVRRGIIRDKEELDELANVFNASYMQYEEQYLPFWAQVLRNKIYATYFFLIRDHQSSNSYITKMVELLESKPQLIKYDPIEYIQAVSNRLNILHSLKKEEERDLYLKKLEELYLSINDYKSHKVQQKIFESYHYHNMNKCIGEGEYEYGYNSLESLKDGFEKYSETISPMGSIVLPYFAGIISYSAGHTAEAQHWIQKAIAQESAHLRPDILSFSKIIDTITSFDLDESNLLKAKLKNLYGHLYKKEKRYQFENLLMEFIRAVQSKDEKTSLKELFIVFEEKLKVISKDPFENKAFEYFKFMNWVESQINAEPFSETVKKTISIV